MTIRKLALAGAMMLVCTLPAAAQTAASLPVKDSTSTTRNIAGQADASGSFHYRDIMEGLTGGGTPDAFLTDGSGHQLVTLFGTPTFNLGTAPTLTVTGPLTSAQLTAAALSTAANQATAQASFNAMVAALQTPTAAPTASNIATAQGSVTTTVAALVAARTGRRSVTIENTGTTPVYIGGSGVTSTTGFLLPGVAGASVTINFSGAVYAITASGTATVTEYEIY